MRGVIRLFSSDNYLDKYNELKRLEGEIVNYSLKVQNEELTDDDAQRIHLFLHAFRSSMQSAKNIKDIDHNLRAFESSSNDSKLAIYSAQKNKLNELFMKFTAFIHSNHESTRFEELAGLKQENYTMHQEFIGTTYASVKKHELDETEIATLLNVNREFYNANKALTIALSDLMLEPEESKDFDKIPDPLGG